MTKPTIAADDVVELRKRPRFLVPNINGKLNGTPATVLDVAAGGLQIEHEGAVRLGSLVHVAIEGEETIEVKGRVIWSSFHPTETRKNSYRSGLQFENVEEVAGKLGRFIRAYGRPDSGSLERKRERLQARRGRKPTMVYVSTIDQDRINDELMMIQHARIHLSSSPDEALKWYNRAKFALTERIDIATELAAVPHRQEVLAVWEYLERRVAIATIIRAFDSK